MTSTIIPTKDVAALLRKELRTAFPGVRFSVRCSTGTASAWINVTYDDGPTHQQVQAITGRFEGRSFNGQTDSYDDHGSLLVAGDGDEMPTAVRYSCDGIIVTRNYSPAGHLAAQRVLREDRAACGTWSSATSTAPSTATTTSPTAELRSSVPAAAGGRTRTCRHGPRSGSSSTASTSPPPRRTSSRTGRATDSDGGAAP
jgi:hypothetical protein